MKLLIPTIIATALFVIASGTTHAEEQDAKQLSGKGELAYIKKTGNTETESLAGKLTITYALPQWEHYGKVEVYTDETDNITTAERYSGEYKLSYLLSERDYFFGNARYVEDRFEDIDLSQTYTAGWGHHFYKEEKHKLKTELGAGHKNYDYITAADSDETILRGYLDFLYGLTETTDFTQTILVEAGDENTFIETDSGLSVAINSALALKAGFIWRDNSDPVAGNKKSDTVTSLALTYDF